jgi:hypothetical protein
MNLQGFIPNFIKRFDHYLLTHFPIVWQSRIHYVLYSVIITNIIFGGLAMLMPVNFDSLRDLDQWVWLFFIVSISYLVVWMIHVGRFNLFKQFGKRPIGDEYLNFFLNFISILLIASTMFSFPYFYVLKVKNLVSNYELAQDINTLNLGAPFFPRNYYQYKTKGEEEDGEQKMFLYNYNNFREFGYEEFLNKLENKRFVENWNGEAFEESIEVPIDNGKSLKKADTCKQGDSKYGLNCESFTRKQFQQKKSRAEQLELIQNFLNVAKKYEIVEDSSAAYFLGRFNANYDYKYYPDSIYYGASRTNQFLNDKINSIIRNKTRTPFYAEAGFLHFMWYLLFYLTLFFMIYRNVSRRHFVLTFVSGIVIMVVSAIFIGLGGHFNQESIFGLYFTIYLGLAIGAFLLFASRSQTWFQAVCLNLFILATPFMPVFYYQTHDHSYYDYQSEWHPIFNFEIAGFVIFFLLLQLVYKKLYSINWSLPEK